MSFKKNFNQARKEGKDSFIFNNKIYNTKFKKNDVVVKTIEPKKSATELALIIQTAIKEKSKINVTIELGNIIKEHFDNDIKTIRASTLKKLLKDEQPDFLEFIVAVLYRLAHSDNLYSQSEDDDIREVSKIFGIKRDLSDNCKDLFSDLFLKVTNLIKKKTENINA
jgi:tellurite resistance protein